MNQLSLLSLTEIQQQVGQIVENEQNQSPAGGGDGSGQSGGPTQDVSTIDARSLLGLPKDQRPPIIENLLDPEEGLLITAQTGVGKSMIVTQGALDLAEGGRRRFLGVEGFRIPESHTILVVQSENTLRLLRGRIEMQAQNRNQDILNRIHFPFDEQYNEIRLRGDLEDPDFLNQLGQYIEATEADILVLDPWISYISCNENDNVGVRRNLDNLTDLSSRYSLAFILTHHHGKNLDLQGHYLARGGSALVDWASTVFTIKQRTNGILDIQILTRSFKKPDDFSLKRNGLVFEALQDNASLTPKRIAEILKDAGGVIEKQKTFADLIGGSYGAAVKAIKKAVKAGLIKEEKMGTKEKSPIRFTLA